MRLVSGRVLMMAATVTTVGLLAACSAAAPTGTPGVERTGKYLLRNASEDISVVIGYKYAIKNLGEPWLLLDVAVSGQHRSATEIKRENVFVITPSGQRIDAPTQREFGQAYSELQSSIRRADIASEPLDYFGGDKRRCEIPFFAIPGTTTTSNSLFVNDRQACTGRLYFPIPGGVQAGGWVFGIDLKESKVRIPFVLEPEPAS